jgi:ketosteroid isomerase-like protein
MSAVCKTGTMATGRPQRVGASIGTAEKGAIEPAGAEAVCKRFARAMLAGDHRAAAACFSPAARILTADGTEVRGRAAVEAVLRQVTASEQQLEIRIGRSVVAEGVASCTQFWRRGGPRSKQGAHEESTAARLVLARTDSRWQIVIASPWE